MLFAFKRSLLFTNGRRLLTKSYKFAVEVTTLPYLSQDQKPSASSSTDAPLVQPEDQFSD